MTKQNTPATFYRVCHDISGQGLWYTPTGEFTGLIHGQLDFCANKDLKMPYDADIVGYLSATKTIEELLTWFPLKDIQRLEDFGFFITEYAASDYKFYKNHWIINQATSVVVRVIPVTEITATPTEVKEPEEKQSTPDKDDYEPFGFEWEKSMNKHSKKELIQLLKKAWSNEK